VRKRGGGGLILVGLGWAVVGLLGARVRLGPPRPRSDVPVEDFDPARYAGKTGRLVLPYKGHASVELVSAGASKLLRCSTDDGVLLVPAGVHRIVAYHASIADERGETWTASRYFWGSEQRDLTVAADGSHPLDIGPPFKALVAVRRGNGDEVRLDLKVAGADGGSYRIAGGRASREPPSFQAVAPSGEVVWQGQFRFG
jgi:hypothetical protein